MSIAACIRTCDCKGCVWQRQRIEKFRTRGCAVCAIVPPEGDYMATDEVWAALNFAQNELVCFTCFVASIEVKLGRSLVPEDLRDCPGNVPLLWALRRGSVASSTVDAP